MTNQPKVHALSAAPFHVDRPWYALDATETPDAFGPIVLLCTDGAERNAHRNASKILVYEGLPDGVTVKAWRFP